MTTIYVYVLDTLADWEIGYVTAELNSGRFFKKSAERIAVKTVSRTKEPVRSMGGMAVIPDYIIEEIDVNKENVLLLPGADSWNDAKHRAVIEKAGQMLACGGTVCAICGATVALASAGLLNDRPHTSNGAGFLEMFASGYKGQRFYANSPSVADGNLITAGSTGGLLWAKQIIERLDVFSPETLEAWYNYFSTGKPEHFFALMNTVQG